MAKTITLADIRKSRAAMDAKLSDVQHKIDALNEERKSACDAVNEAQKAADIEAYQAGKEMLAKIDAQIELYRSFINANQKNHAPGFTPEQLAESYAAERVKVQAQINAAAKEYQEQLEKLYTSFIKLAEAAIAANELHKNYVQVFPDELVNPISHEVMATDELYEMMRPASVPVIPSDLNSVFKDRSNYFYYRDAIHS